MSRWFRHYAGMMRDEKLVSAAVKSKQPVERVVWVWGAILESASEINDNGRYEFDSGEAAYFLRCDVSELDGIIACLEGLGRLSAGVVTRWSDRQYSSDSAAERQRRYRERKSGSSVRSGDDHRNGDGGVTSRDAAVTPQETETELDTEKKERKRARGTRLPSDFQLPDEWRDWALNRGLPASRIHIEFEKLTNWAANAPASKAVKPNWFRAWQNWVIGAIDALPKTRDPPPPKVNPIRAVIANLSDRMEAADANAHSQTGPDRQAPLRLSDYR